MSLLEVDDLSCHAEGQPLLRRITLRVDYGEILGLVGPSGAGKSMLLRSLLGLAPPGVHGSGTLLWRGGDHERRFDLGRRADMAGLRGRDIALLAQDAGVSLDPVQRIGAQIREVLAVHGRRARTEDLLARVGLPAAVVAAHPHRLSSGMAQRAALALALASKPTLLLADEPTASLDNPSQWSIVDLVLGLCREHRLAVVWVSHDIAFLGRVCPRLIVLADGEIVDAGPTGRILAQPAHAVSRAFVRETRRAGEAWSRAIER